jgi:lysine 6-dehydrogenase
MPWTFAGKLRTHQNKPIRYPGHLAQMRACNQLGLWDTEPVRVGEQDVVPREVFHALFAPRVTFRGDRDVCAILIHALGRKDGQPARAVVEVMDFYDEETGFTAMERSTGWDAAIVAAMMARGQVPRGAVPVELAVPPDPFVTELARRGIEARARVEAPPAG